MAVSDRQSATDARRANDEIRGLAFSSGRKRRLVGLVCECGREGCGQPLAATVAEYDALRDDPNHRIVVVGHVRDDDRVVVRADHFWIVSPRASARRTQQ